MTDRTFPILLTFDLDGESLALAADPGNVERPGVLSTGRYGPTTGVYHILEALEEEAIPATFFVPGWTAEHYPDAVRAIAEGGHEVGHHGYTHVSPANQSYDEERRSLEKGIEILEGLTGEVPRGYRSPSWDFSNHTMELLKEYGFKYSSNFMDDDKPYIHPGDGPRIVELPVQWMLDDAPFYLFRPPFTRPISPPGAAYQTWSEELEALAQQPGTLFVLTMHPQLSGRPSRVKRVRKLIQLARSIPHARFMRCGEAADMVFEEGSE